MEGLVLFAVSLCTLGAIYAILCLALNLESGIGGLWDLGIVSYFGIGAYTYVLLTAPAANGHQEYMLGLGLPMWVGLVSAGVVSGLCAWLIGLPSLRLKREYFLITTIAFAEVLRQIFMNEAWLTNGVAGIYGLAQPLHGLVEPLNYPYLLLAITLVGLLIAYLAVERLSQGAFGRSLKAIRENEALAITAGIDPKRYNMRAYVVAGTISGLAGVCYVWYNTLLLPAQVSSDITFFVWTAVIIGGLGNNAGALVGGFLFILLHDLLRFAPVSGETAVALSSLRTALVGAALILILRLRPKGLLPERPRIFPGGSSQQQSGSFSQAQSSIGGHHA